MIRHNGPVPAILLRTNTLPLLLPTPCPPPPHPITPRTAVTHKMTKRSLTQLTQSLAQELKQAGGGECRGRDGCSDLATLPPSATTLFTLLLPSSPPLGLESIGVHNLSPGLVLTDLLLRSGRTGAGGRRHGGHACC